MHIYIYVYLCVLCACHPRTLSLLLLCLLFFFELCGSRDSEHSVFAPVLSYMYIYLYVCASTHTFPRRAHFPFHSLSLSLLGLLFFLYWLFGQKDSESESILAFFLSPSYTCIFICAYAHALHAHFTFFCSIFCFLFFWLCGQRESESESHLALSFLLSHICACVCVYALHPREKQREGDRGRDSVCERWRERVSLDYISMCVYTSVCVCPPPTLSLLLILSHTHLLCLSLTPSLVCSSPLFLTHSFFRSCVLSYTLSTPGA